MTVERQSYRARWLFPVDGEPIAGGTIEIQRGVITAVHSRLDPRAEDLGNVALLPGLINAHTHLEFSDLAEPLAQARPFSAWIRALVALRRARTADVTTSIRRGLDESLGSGVTTVGEIATTDWPLELGAAPGPRGVVFRELLGFSPERVDEQLAVAERHLDACAGSTGDFLPGLSPHSPYSVHPELLDKLVGLAVLREVPLAMHLAETKAECELLQHGTGDLVGMLRALGAWQAGVIPPQTVPLDYLRHLAVADHALVVHGNYLSADEIRFVVEHPQLTVVYCPRTHAYFGHAPHPWLELLAGREDAVVLGTDSRASNPDLNLWNEVLFLRKQFPNVNPRHLLQMATLNGAHALGRADEVGSLTPGKIADLNVVQLAGDGSDPFEALFSPAGRIVGTMCAGHWHVRPQ
jgi:cytosine/adenosine deaminase-related metal-dependent hydrolase